MVETRGMKRRAQLVDYMSLLPDAILLHILSFLPLWDCMKTSFISKRFWNLWTQASSLTFNELKLVHPFFCKNKCPICRNPCFPIRRHCMVHRMGAGRKVLEDALERVFLMHSSCTMDKFRLSFNYVSEARKHKKLDTWLRIALSGNIKEIDIGFHDRDLTSYLEREGFIDSNPYQLYEIPTNHLSPKFLKRLTLYCCKLKVSGFKRLESLQTLTLKSVLIADSSVTQLVSRCPAIMDLKMEQCLISQNFFVSEEDLQIRGLYVQTCFANNPPNIEIDLSTPHLEKLMVTACVVTKLRIRKATKLAGAHLDIIPNSKMEGLEMNRALAGLKSCQTLRLTCRTIRALPPWRIMIAEPIILFPHLLQLAFVGAIGKQVFLKLVDLLGRCKNLKYLHIYVEQGQSSAGQNQEVPAFDEDNLWQSPEVPYCYPQKHLKKVTVSGFTGNKQEKNLIRFLLAKAEVLEGMTISYYVRHNRQRLRQEVVNEIMGYHRASGSAQLWFPPTS